MGSVVAGESHQNHVDDGQNGKSEDTGHGQSQQGLVEIIVQQGAEVVAGTLDALALGSDVHADAALLDLDAPGVDEGDDEDDGQQAVKHDLDRVVTANPHIGIEDGIILETALDGTDGGAGPEPVALGQPVGAAAGNQHVTDKDYFKYQEQNTSQDLSVVKIAETKNNERELYSPVALGKSGANVNKQVFDADSNVFEEIQNRQTELFEPTGDRAEEQLELIEKSIKLIQF